MFQQRKLLLEKLEAEFGFKSMLYVTGDRTSVPGMQLQVQIQDDVLPVFLDHLDRIGSLGKVDHLGLVLYSRGGSITAGWSLINLLRQFCNKLTIIVPYRAQSTATLMCLGADSIVMTKQAILGPIDPSTNTFFNPIPPGFNMSVPLSVEDLAAYLEMARSLKLGSLGMTQTLLKLSDHVNPVAIGTVYRVRSQIRALADKLMCLHGGIRESKRKDIIKKLCEDSGSHDYTIHRREAQESGLNITKPNDAQYRIIKEIYDDFEQELELNNPFSPQPPAPGAVVQHSLKRALVESPGYRSHTYVSDWSTAVDPSAPGQIIVQPTFQGWR